MPLFTPSTTTWTDAVGHIADTAGASGDSEMRTRAHRSLRAAFQQLNRRKWQFARSEGVPIQVYAPFTVTGVSASAGEASAAAPAGHGLAVDDIIVGDGFRIGTRVSATAASGFGIFGTVSATAAGVSVITATATRDYYSLPSDWKVGYSVRLLGTQKALTYIQRRIYDRYVVDEFSAGSPEGYDLFGQGGRGRIRLLPPPNGSDVLFLRYYRRLYIGTATGDTTALDIPEDYEQTPIAWAKWHFLTDKQEGRGEQATTWLSLAQDGIKTMLADETTIPDENLAFTPGYSMEGFGGDRSTRYIWWDHS